MNDSDGLKTSDFKIPSPPAIAMRVLDAVKDKNSCSSTLAKIISSDPALASKILKLANSSLYCLPNKVETLNKAITILGTEALKTIALSFIIARDYRESKNGGFNYDAFWERSLTEAVAAKVFATSLRKNKDQIFVTGLLQDIGILIMHTNESQRYSKVLDKVKTTESSIIRAEKEEFGFDHQELGAEVLKNWGLPEEIYQPIRIHHMNPDASLPDQLKAKILFWSDMAATVYHEKNSIDALMSLRQQIMDTAGFNGSDIDSMIETIGSQCMEIFAYFDVQPGNLKPYSQLLQEANEELGKLNLSYEQLIIELKQSKENAEGLANKLKAANEQLTELAMRDGLTGIFNHSFFQDLIDKEMSKSKRYQRPLSLILFDIDQFKWVNDTFGHIAGDKVLKKICEVSIENIRDTDTIARYGGDEFAIVLPETEINGAKMLAVRLRRIIECLQFYSEDGSAFSVTISVGISCYNFLKNHNNRSMFINDADQALYQSKRNGRNRVSVAS